MKFDLDAWARISEIATAIIVVVSLIYIAIELDRNTRATYTSSWDSVTSKLISLDIAEATELGSFIETAELDPTQVSHDEYFRFSRIAVSRLAVIENAYLGIRNETLGDYHWAAISEFLKFQICKPGYRKVWEDTAQIWHPDYLSYVNEVKLACSD